MTRVVTWHSFYASVNNKNGFEIHDFSISMGNWLRMITFTIISVGQVTGSFSMQQGIILVIISFHVWQLDQEETQSKLDAYM